MLERLAGLIKAADAFIIVSGEYNHSIPPALSNLLDHFLEEYFWRPSAIVCYSAGAFGGVRAAMQLRAMLCELGTPSIPQCFQCPTCRTPSTTTAIRAMMRTTGARPGSRRARMVRERPESRAKRACRTRQQIVAPLQFRLGDRACRPLRTRLATDPRHESPRGRDWRGFEPHRTFHFQDACVDLLSCR